MPPGFTCAATLLFVETPVLGVFRLAAAIQSMLRHEHPAGRAKTQGARMANEDGVAAAARLMAQLHLA